MMQHRAVVVARRVILQLRRDKRTLLLILLQPIIIMAVFGYAFGGDVTGARVGVANLDRGTLGAKVLDNLNHTTVESISYDSGAEAEDALRRGDVRMAVVIPSNFSRAYASASSANPERMILIVYKDNTNIQVTAAALKAFGDAVRDAFEEESGQAASFALEERVVFGQEDARALEFFVPGIAAFTIFQLGSLLTVVTIVKERTLGTLPRLMASPARRGEIVLGYTAAFTLLSIFQAISILMIAVFIFRVPVHGSIFLALIATTLVGVVALGFGILVSGLARNEFQAVQAVFLLAFPNLFLAGVFTPPEAMPGILRPMMKLIPLSYAVDALRETLNHGRTFGEVFPQLAILAGFAILFLAVATVSFARKS